MFSKTKTTAPLFAALLVLVVAKAAVAGPTVGGQATINVDFRGLAFVDAFALAARKAGVEPILATTVADAKASRGPRLNGKFNGLSAEEALSNLACREGRLLFLETINGKPSAVLLELPQPSYAAARSSRFDRASGATLAAAHVRTPSLDNAPLADAIAEFARAGQVNYLYDASLVEGLTASWVGQSGNLDEMFEALLAPHKLEADWTSGYLSIRAK